MSTNLIDSMTEREAKSCLNDIACLLRVAGQDRTSAQLKSEVERLKLIEKPQLGRAEYQRLIELTEAKNSTGE